MKTFPLGARVCFLGDSITEQGHFHCHIQNHYYIHHPERKITAFNYGVPGDTAGGCLRTRRHHLMVDTFHPSDVVMMFGMNDVARWYYTKEGFGNSDHALLIRKNHTEAMLTIARDLLARGVSRLYLCSSPPFDDILQTGAESGISDALTAMYDADLEAFAREGIPLSGTFDFGRQMVSLLSELKEMGAESFIGGDRVHPLEIGHHVMARIFLALQGEDVALPSAASIADGSVKLPPLHERISEKRALEAFLRSLSFLDFNQQWGQEQMTDEEKCAYWQKAENIERMRAQGVYQHGRAIAYPTDKPREKDMLARLLTLTDHLYD